MARARRARGGWRERAAVGVVHSHTKRPESDTAHPAAMDDEQIGAAVRALRVRQRLRQADVAVLARVRLDAVIAVERGSLGDLEWRTVRAVVTAVGGTLATDVRWQGSDMDRLLSQGHAAMHELLGRFFAGLPDWEMVPEVSFSIYGERGVIDLLAWHAASRSLLIIELKTALGDPQALVSTMDRRVRLGRAIAAERGWQPLTVSAWVVFAESRTNRRHVKNHDALLGARFAADGHAMRAWLRAPSGAISALSFWTDVGDRDRMRPSATPRRVRHTRAERAARVASAGDPADVETVGP